MQNLFPIILFIFGMAVGSFLNVVILRLGTGRTVVRGRSMCLSCGRELRWYELVPVVSFLIQRGRCRQCGSRVSWQYPLVELLTGVLFVLVGAVMPQLVYEPLWLAYYLIVTSILVVIAVYDLRHQIIPDSFVYAFVLLGLGALVVRGVTAPALLAGPVLAAPLAALWLISHGRWIGLGDAKLALGMGWFLGLAEGASALIFSFWIGAAAGLLLIAATRIHARFVGAGGYSMKSEIPFGPFMVLATLIVLFTHFNLFTLWITVPW